MDRRHHRRGAVAATLAAALLVGGGATAVATAATGTDAAATTAATSSVTTTAASTARIVRTDAPLTLRIGAPRQTIQIAVQTNEPMDAARVSLVGGSGRVGPQGTSTKALPGRSTTQRADVVLDVTQLPGWGRLGWELSGWRTSDGSCTLVDHTVRVDVRAHSQAALKAVKRSGEKVRVQGALRAYHTVKQQMVPWAGRPVEIQRHDGKSWQRVATATTTKAGAVDLTVTAPRGSYLRVVAADTGRIWGVTSDGVRV